MRLFLNDVLMSAEPGMRDLMAAFESLLRNGEGRLELRRGPAAYMLAHLMQGEGDAGAFFNVARVRGEEVIGAILEHDQQDDVAEALQEYRRGKNPRLFEEDLYDPDCPICAAMAGRSSPPAPGNGAREAKGPAGMLAGIIQRLWGDRDRVSGHA